MSENEIIIVRPQRNPDYVVINKSALEDDRLSWCAKGIHAYLQLKAKDSKLTKRELESLSTDGSTKINNAINELKECGYLQITPKRGEGGRMAGWIWTVYESPSATPAPAPAPAPADADAVAGSDHRNCVYRISVETFKEKEKKEKESSKEKEKKEKENLSFKEISFSLKEKNIKENNKESLKEKNIKENNIKNLSFLEDNIIINKENERKKKLEKFEEFWRAYPARDGRKLLKGEAREFFMSKFDLEDFPLLMQAVQNYANSRAAREGYVRDAIRFLKKDYWRGWIDSEVKQTIEENNTFNKIRKGVRDYERNNGEKPATSKP